MLVHQSRCSCELQIVCACSESSTYHHSALMCNPEVLADEIQWEFSVPWVKVRLHGFSCKVRAREKDFLTPTKILLLRQKASIVFSLSLPINGLWHLDENVVFMNHTPFPVFKRKAICISLSPIWNGFFYFTSTLTLVLLFSQIFFFKLLWTCIKCFRALAKCHSLGTFKREVGLTENKFPL